MSKIKVAILGSTGMLGNAVAKHFLSNDKYEVYTSYRNETLKYDDKSFYFDVDMYDLSKYENLPLVDYVINCIGIIKPFMSLDKEKSIYINSIFPHVMAGICNRIGDWCGESGGNPRARHRGNHR